MVVQLSEWSYSDFRPFQTGSNDLVHSKTFDQYAIGHGAVEAVTKHIRLFLSENGVIFFFHQIVLG